MRISLRAAQDTDDFPTPMGSYRGKTEKVKYFCQNILPNVFTRHATRDLEDTSAVDIPAEVF